MEEYGQSVGETRKNIAGFCRRSRQSQERIKI